jgi:hypothetical protein
MEPIDTRLRRDRTTATSLELDELKLRAMRQAAGRRGTRGNLMKSRLALLLVLVAGLMMSTTGATLALSGSSGSGSAGQSQYQRTPPDSNGQTLAGTEEGDQGAPPAGRAGGGEQPAAAQEAAQVAATTDDGVLPFTGLLAIPLLIGGVALMGTGTFLHRRARS